MAAVHNAAFAPWIDSLPPVYRQTPVEACDVDSWAGRVLVAAGDEGIVGYAHIDVSDREVDFLVTDEHAGQSRIAVHPGYRRRGIGRRLVEHASRHGERLRGRIAWAGAYSDNHVANGFLSALGFHRIFADDSVLATLDLSRFDHHQPDVPGLLVREVQESDADGMRDVFGQSQSKIFGTDPTRSDIEGWLSSGWSEVIYVAQMQEKVVGSMEFRSWGVLGITGVIPAYRRRGIGTALLVRTLAAMRDKGITHALADTRRQDQAAIRLYERLGFDVSRTGQGWARPASGGTPTAA